MAKQGKSKPITTAVLGLGRSGWNIHIKGIRGRKDYQVVDVADPIQSRLEEARDEFGCNTYTDVKTLLKHTTAELVIVATKSIDHYAHTMAALKAGRHVLVEKPMAMTWAQTRRMLALAKQKRRKLFVHQNLRFSNEAQLLKYYCSGKTPIGTIFSIVNQGYSFARRNDWQTLKKNGGGLLNNKLTHIIDTLLYATGGTVDTVLSDMQHTTDSGDCEDHCILLMKLANGVSINIIDSSSCNADAPKWILMGYKGTAMIGNNGVELRYFNPSKHKKMKAQDSDAADNRAYGNKEVLKWKTVTNAGKRPSIGDYYDNIVSVLRKKGSMVVPPESVVEMTRVLEICRKQNPAFKM